MTQKQQIENHRELSGKRIVVLGGSSGIGRTNLWQSMNADAREHLYESVGKSLLVGRVGEACEIARAYLFLMQQGYGTGQSVVLDGGAALV
jgi:NAD(P)-dependent dehydrogenase (short-subunit alcohol dehydrogenase family)